MASKVMEVAAVPASIDRERLRSIFADLGIDLRWMPEGSTVQIGWDAVRCEVIALGEDGQPFVDETGQAIAKHSITVPVVD